MSTTQILVLGALAGFTIFLGLPVGRIRSTDTRLKAALSAAATGILLFLFWDVIVHGIEPVENALNKAHDEGGSWVDFVKLALTFGAGMAGDEESAVSVIRLVEELDAGPIGASRDLSIGGDATAGDVYREVGQLAPALIDDALASDSFAPQVGEPTYAEKIGQADRELDWSRPAKQLHDRIRALSPHIGARGEVEGRNVIVWRSRLDGERLELLEVQPEGGTRMSYDAWLRGLRS